MNSLLRDIASLLAVAFASDGVSATAGGAGDNTEAPGTVIDLLALPSRAESVMFAITARSTLAATATLSLTAKIEHSDQSGAGFTDLVPAASFLTLTGGAGGSTERGVAKVGVSLEYAKRYIRVSLKPDLSAGATDTAVIDAIAIFGGSARTPV
ncbi:hypothetical protein [Ancylobacter defluvii]|uniref:Uncharacterized protein n=1 Tax=Ancylobacter defluvii TaxID=1282440 RepID=A0A9W6NDF8_9HYPH|nr:hypothetical protein [Ancylobacter defluvii]MBS7588284.1 hypothetical protein [Ancylobacter defluvii]GLK86680.1 hypothetical protein GCM10017653_47500 [Ancylobacter defluvii]